MELNDYQAMQPYVRAEKNTNDPPNIVLLLNNRQLGMRNKPINQIQQFIEQKTSQSEMRQVDCNLPPTARSSFLISFNSNCTKVASTHGDHNIYVCDVQSGKRLNTLVGHRRTPWCISFHPVNPGILASGCLAGEVRVWDLDGGSESWQVGHDQVIASLTFHPSVHLLVIATGNTLYFWDWRRDAPFSQVSTNSPLEKVRFVKFDPYGYRLITGITNLRKINKKQCALLSSVHSHQQTDSARQSMAASEEQSTSSDDSEEDADEDAAHTQSGGESYFPYRQGFLKKFVTRNREGRIMYRPETFALNRTASNQGVTTSNRFEIPRADREELTSSSRAEESSNNVVRSETRLFVNICPHNPISDEDAMPPEDSSFRNRPVNSFSDEPISRSRAFLDAERDLRNRIQFTVDQHVTQQMTDVTNRMNELKAEVSTISKRILKMPMNKPQPSTSQPSTSQPSTSQPSTSSGQTSENINIYEFMTLNREPKSIFYANMDFWEIFLTLRSICESFESRLSSERLRALEVEHQHEVDDTPISRSENRKINFYGNISPITDMLCHLEESLSFPVVSYGAVQDTIRQVRILLTEGIQLIESCSDSACLSFSNEDIILDLTCILNEYLLKIMEAENLFTNSTICLQGDSMPSDSQRSSGIENSESDLSRYVSDIPEVDRENDDFRPIISSIRFVDEGPKDLPLEYVISSRLFEIFPYISTLINPVIRHPIFRNFSAYRNFQSAENTLQDIDDIVISPQSASDPIQTSRTPTLSLSNVTENSSHDLNPSDQLQITNTPQSMHPLLETPIRRNSIIYPPRNRQMDGASQSTQTPMSMFETSEVAEQLQSAELSDFSVEEMASNLLHGANTSPASSHEDSDSDTDTVYARALSNRYVPRVLIEPLPQSGLRSALIQRTRSIEPDSDDSSDNSGRPTTPPVSMNAPNFPNMVFNRNPQIEYNDVITQNHRIQLWNIDVSSFVPPEIYKAKTNVVVKRCLIHNDASIDVSQDGTKIVVIVPPEDNDQNHNTFITVFSLITGHVSRIFGLWGDVANAISVSFSPLAHYVIVGSAYSRPAHNRRKIAVARIIKFNRYDGNVDLTHASYIRGLLQNVTNENGVPQMSLNCVKWLPQSGLGIAYATNRGQLYICHPVAGELRGSPDGHDEEDNRHEEEDHHVVEDMRYEYLDESRNWAMVRYFADYNDII